MVEDEPHEWGLDPMTRYRILENRGFEGPQDPAREAAKAHGWEFVTDSLLSFIRCPACKEQPEGILHRQVAEARKAKVIAAAQVLEGDDDALAAILAEQGGV